MKVIKPLFLDDLYEEFEHSLGKYKRLLKLADRLSKIKVFDPACGSGNFLIIAFKELKRLEMKIFKELNSFSFSQITPSQFYGIEIDDFAHELAKLSLWLTEHQMNIEFLNEFNRVNPTLPLKNAGNITCGNATRVNWDDICSKDSENETYVLGNPPYLGARIQNQNHKSDMSLVFEKLIKNYKNLDYITCWFMKGAEYINNTNIKLAFVSTNSIFQGVNASLIWPEILDKNIEIFFAYPSFKWKNNAKFNAGVVVSIIGLRNLSNQSKYLFTNSNITKVKNINPYLINGPSIFVQEHKKKSISFLPKMTFGSMPNDNGSLILSQSEYEVATKNNPEIKKLIKKFTGSQEYIKGENRYCLWITDDLKNLASSIPFVIDRINSCKNHRLKSDRKATLNLAEYPWRFGEVRHINSNSIIVPSVSSDLRDYIPIGFLNRDTVISNLGLAVYQAEPWLMSILTSKIHTMWVRVVSGRLGNCLRYSVSISYNSFPFPNITMKQKEDLNRQTFNILRERERHPEKNLSELYDSENMPNSLKDAHFQNDLVVESCYESEPFKNDEDRLEYLFKLYEKMTGKEEVM